MITIESITFLAHKLVFAAGIVLVGFFLIKKFEIIYTKAIKKAVNDDTFENFFNKLINYLLKAIVLIISAGTLGVETTSIIAILGATGFAIGLAFQGALSNFAGGILLIVLRPFVIGEFIEIDGKKGNVEEISILSTTIVTTDNKVITMPNGKITNGDIINYSRKPIRRVDIDFYAGYGEDAEHVIKVIKSVIASNQLILRDKEIFVDISEHGSSSITYTSRVWVESAYYWPVYFYLMKNVKIAFDKENIEIPYQKIDVNVNS